MISSAYSFAFPEVRLNAVCWNTCHGILLNDMISDNDDADEQQSHGESQIQSPGQVTGMSHPAVAAPGMQYVAPPHLGPANSLVKL